MSRRKFYFDGGQVEIAAHLVYELDPNGKQLRVVRYTDYAADAVRTLCPNAPALRQQWADPMKRAEIIQGAARARRELRRAGRGSEAAGSRPVRPAMPPGLQRAAAHSARAGAAAQDREAGFLRTLLVRRRAPYSKSCLRNMPSTGTRSLSCRTCSMCRRSRPMVRSPKSSASSAEPIGCALP